MAPDVEACTVQSVLGWWQGREDYLLKQMPSQSGLNYTYTYLDHAIYCSKYIINLNYVVFISNLI